MLNISSGFRKVGLITVRDGIVTRIFSRSLSLAYDVHKPSGRDRCDTEPRPIIVLHGLFGSKRNNRSISKVLARDLKTEVFALDLRNHGDSPHSESHDYNCMADDVEEFIQDQKLSPATVIGHSMGAKVAMTLALRSPRKVANLIPVDNAPVDALLKSDFQKYVRAMQKILDSGVQKQSEADKILQDYEESLPIRQFLLTNLIKDQTTDKLAFKVPVNILRDSLDKMGDFPFKDPQQSRFSGPTLVIRGTKSHYVADDVLPLIGGFFPSFKLQDIDCGHWVISEKPEEFRRAVVDFLTTSTE